MDPNQIQRLAKLLRDSGDKVLNSAFKLTLSGHILRALNDSFSLIIDENDLCSSQSFCVSKPNSGKSDVFRDLQFIYDFIQKTLYLNVNQLHCDDQMEGFIDISKFRNLKKLEVNKVFLSKITGIQQLRSQLEEVVCIKNLSSVRAILLVCGADNSTGLVWNKLKVADFSYNNLTSIDTSIELAPWLQNLIMSHNQLGDINAIRLCANLKMLDLSFNKLNSVPTFHAEASRRLTVLILKNNFIENLSGISCLDTLNELDLSGNCLIDHSSLLPISTLAELRKLNLQDNPLFYHPIHRDATARYLHSNTTSAKFILDFKPLTKYEKSLTGSYNSYHSILTSRILINTRNVSNNISSPNASNNSVVDTSSNTNTTLTESPHSSHDTKLTEPQKRLKIRKAIISDYAEDMVKSKEDFVITDLEGNKEHLETKRKIEDLRKQFGDSWLHSQRPNSVQKILGSSTVDSNILTRTSLVDDLYTERVESFAHRRMLDLNTDKLQSTPKQENSAFAINTESPIKKLYNNLPDLKSDSSTNLETIYQSTNTDNSLSDQSAMNDFYSCPESDSEDNEILYLVQKVNSEENIILAISDVSIKEKDIDTKRTKVRWSIKSLESCERIKSDVLTVNFDTIRKDRKQRDYKMTKVECQKVEHYLRDILSKRPLSEMNQIVYRCINCTTQFSRETINKKSFRDVICPECKSSFVIEIQETPQGTAPLKELPIQSSNSALFPAKSNIIPKSDSHSSIGSAGSLNDSSSCSKISNCNSSFDSNQSVAGSSTSERDRDTDFVLSKIGNESDVEILSNPSQSSIEVLDSRYSSRKHSEERRISQAPSLDTISDGVANNLVVAKILKDSETVSSTIIMKNTLTESSSSGSITDSICTTYEQNKELDEKSSADILVNKGMLFDKRSTKGSGNANILLKTSDNEKAVDKIDSSNILQKSIQFSFTNYGIVDHSLKIYLYQSVFKNSEQLKWLIRGRLYEEIPMNEINTGNEAIIIMSDLCFYIFFVIANELDDPSKWLKQYRTGLANDITDIQLLPFKIGVTLTIKSSEYFHLLLKDNTRTDNFVAFLNDNISISWHLEKIVSEKLENKLLNVTMSEKPETLIFFTSCCIFLDEKNTFIENGGLIITKSKLYLISSNYEWIFKNQENDIEMLYCQEMTDMIECEIKSDIQIILNFLDEYENRCEQWRLTFATQNSLNSVIFSIREPWEALFGVPLPLI